MGCRVHRRIAGGRKGACIEVKGLIVVARCLDLQGGLELHRIRRLIRQYRHIFLLITM